MTAREMFRELEFYENESKYCGHSDIEYRRETKHANSCISFVSRDQTVEFLFIGKMSLPLYQAITKQMEELGWLE